MDTRPNSVPSTSLEYQFDPTVRFLFQISKDLIIKKSELKNAPAAESMELLLENAKRKIEDDVDQYGDIPGEVVKKIKGHVSESFVLINERRKLIMDRTKAESS